MSVIAFLKRVSVNDLGWNTDDKRKKIGAYAKINGGFALGKKIEKAKNADG